MMTYTTPLPSLITTNTTLVNVTETRNSIIAFKVLTEVLCVLITICGVVGNVLVLIVFVSRWAVLKTYEVFIITLAVADLLGTIMLPCIQVHEVSGGSFQGIGTVGCKIVYFLSSTSIYVSSLTLTMVSIDRYIAVKWPLKEREYICRMMITITWVLGFSGGMIYLLGDRVMLYKQDEKQWVCRMFANTSAEVTIISLTTFSIQNAIPVVVMSILYCLIVYELHKSSNHSKFCVGEEEIRRRRTAIKKTTKLLIIVVIVFFICVTPSNIFYMLYHFDMHGLPDEYIYPVHVVLSMLMMANSCVNPLIYGKLHSSFRKQTISLFVSCLNCVNIRTGLRSSYLYGTSRTCKTSITTSQNGYSHTKGYPCNNEILTTRPSVDFNSQMLWADTYNGQIDVIGRKMSNLSTVTIETDSYNASDETMQKMLEMIKANMEEYDSSSLAAVVYSNGYQNISCDGSPDRETIL